MQGHRGRAIVFRPFCIHNSWKPSASHVSSFPDTSVQGWHFRIGKLVITMLLKALSSSLLHIFLETHLSTANNLYHQHHTLILALQPHFSLSMSLGLLGVVYKTMLFTGVLLAPIVSSDALTDLTDLRTTINMAAETIGKVTNSSRDWGFLPTTTPSSALVRHRVCNNDGKDLTLSIGHLGSVRKHHKHGGTGKRQPRNQSGEMIFVVTAYWLTRDPPPQTGWLNTSTGTNASQVYLDDPYIDVSVRIPSPYTV